MFILPVRWLTRRAVPPPKPEQPKMASRTRKSTAKPVKRGATAVFNYILELPGAEFFGDIAPSDIEYATRLQQIRREYENDGYEEMLWHDLSQMGFSSTEIRQFVANPAAITTCRYYGAGALR
jgi:hypothetical protein